MLQVLDEEEPSGSPIVVPNEKSPELGRGPLFASRPPPAEGHSHVTISFRDKQVNASGGYAPLIMFYTAFRDVFHLPVVVVVDTQFCAQGFAAVELLIPSMESTV